MRGWLVERQIDQPEHVERRHERGDKPNEPQAVVSVAFSDDQRCHRISSLEKKPANGGMPAMASVAINMVVKVVGMRPCQAAHIPHVLFAAHGVDHRARSKEQQRLEERMREHMEHTRRECAHAQRQEHVSQLRDRRVGQHPLDVVLHQADGRREKSPSARQQWPRFSSPSARAQTAHSTAPPCTRPPSPWSRRGSARKPASGLPSRPAARHKEESAPTFRRHRRRAAASPQ